MRRRLPRRRRTNDAATNPARTPRTALVHGGGERRRRGEGDDDGYGYGDGYGNGYGYGDGHGKGAPRRVGRYRQVSRADGHGTNGVGDVRHGRGLPWTGCGDADAVADGESEEGGGGGAKAKTDAQRAASVARARDGGGDRGSAEVTRSGRELRRGVATTTGPSEAKRCASRRRRREPSAEFERLSGAKISLVFSLLARAVGRRWANLLRVRADAARPPAGAGKIRRCCSL